MSPFWRSSLQCRGFTVNVLPAKVWQGQDGFGALMDRVLHAYGLDRGEMDGAHHMNSLEWMGDTRDM